MEGARKEKQKKQAKWGSNCRRIRLLVRPLHLLPAGIASLDAKGLRALCLSGL